VSDWRMQAELACLVLNFISEDLNVFDAVSSEYPSSMRAHSPCQAPKS